LLTAAALLAGTVLLFVYGYLSSPNPKPPASPSAARPDASLLTRSPELSSADPASAASAPPATTAQSPLEAAIDRVLALLERRAATPADLADLKAALLAADPAQSLAAIRAFLRSGRDALTGQGFALGAGGLLTGSPTLRVLLLDTLGQIARGARSPAAAEVAREILAEKTSADEWALALRNLAWTDPQARPFLRDKVREMLRTEPWLSAPSAGMLEALDVVVFTRDATLIPDLDAARTAGGELAHATDIALDRLAETAPLDVLTWLNTHPRTLDDRPFLRADYFAKADIAQGAQRAQIEIYLGRPDITAAEKSKLLNALTTPASFVSETLLSTPAAPDDGTARRAALERVTADWLKTDRFPLLRESLFETRQRLAP